MNHGYLVGSSKDNLSIYMEEIDLEIVARHDGILPDNLMCRQFYKIAELLHQEIISGERAL